GKMTDLSALGLLLILVLWAGTALSAPLGTAARSHGLYYNLTVRSRDGFVDPQFLAEGHLDAQLYLYYDSEKGRAEPRGLWAETVLGNEIRDTETHTLAESGKKLKMTLAEINALQKQKGFLSLQEIWGCEIQEDNHSRGFWDFYYDGEPFFSYNAETHSWMMSPSWAQSSANKLERDTMYTKNCWAHIQGELCRKPCRPLTNSVLSSSVLSTGNVSCNETLEGSITLTCWAVRTLSQDKQPSEDVLPYGNGTYQPWDLVGERGILSLKWRSKNTMETHLVPSTMMKFLGSNGVRHMKMFLLRGSRICCIWPFLCPTKEHNAGVGGLFGFWK
uniref:MHC class I-like antigen recognition-like domain-containing protein n=1 Tax=Castor canadensis TaxID=51338 RepID=A0A8C0VZU9_CASCN